MILLLVDDNKEELAALSSLVLEWEKTVAEKSQPAPKIKLHCCSSAREARLLFSDAVRPLQPDAAILDIVMPEQKGTELAAALRQLGFAGPIAFLTSSNDFASESYEVKASAYLVKPVCKEKLFALMDEMSAALRKKTLPEKDESGIFVKTKAWSGMLFYRKLLWVEVSSHKLFFHIVINNKRETLKSSGSLSDIRDSLLADRRFAVCHDSYIVNMDYIATVRGTEAVMTNGERLPISRRAGSVFRKAYVEYAVAKMKNSE